VIPTGIRNTIFYVLAVIGLAEDLVAQDSLSANGFKVSAHIEIYYAYDFAEPADHRRPDFLYNYARHNEVNLNLGFIKSSYTNA
jgi:hypothetical protein